MEVLGIRGIPLNWIHSYLTDRKQKVTVNVNGSQYTSDYRIVPTGVPQGSTLGPTLFLIFVNDLHTVIQQNNNVLVTQFADDTTFTLSANTIEDLSAMANKSANLMNIYCSKNGLSLNSSKTELLNFSIYGLDYSLLTKIEGKSIPESNSVKFLGLLLDNRLQWHDHINNLCNNLSKKCYVLWQLRDFVPIETLKMYYFAHINSILNYGIVCWGNSSKVRDLFIIQKRVIRIILRKNITHSCRELFPQLQILTISSLFILNCVVYVKFNVSDFVKFSDRNINYNLRMTNNMLLPIHKLALTANGSTIMPQKIYNHLPDSFKRITNIKIFKQKVKNVLLNKSFYSVDEYFSSPLE